MTLVINMVEYIIKYYAHSSLRLVIPIKSSYGPVFFIINNCNLVIINITVKTAY